MTAGPEQVWDPGLQPERTALAWRRIALALTGVAVVLPRLLGGVLGGGVAPPSGVVLGCACLTWRAGHRRYGHTHAGLTSGSGLPTDARALLLPVFACLVVGVTALAALGW